jgi:HEAT repeat protein
MRLNLADEILELREEEQAAWLDQFCARPPEGIEEVLLELLNHSSSSVRGMALTLLERIESRWVTLAWRVLAADPDPRLRAECMMELVRRLDPLDRHRFRLGLRDSNWLVRSDAAEALEDTDPGGAVGQLLFLMHSDPHQLVRRDAAHALAGAGRAVIPALRAALERERSAHARVGILNALASFGNYDSFRLLLLFCRHHNDAVRHNVVNVLGRCHLEKAWRPEAIDALEEMVSIETNPGVRHDAVQWLQELRAGCGPCCGPADDEDEHRDESLKGLHQDACPAAPN